MKHALRIACIVYLVMLLISVLVIGMFRVFLPGLPDDTYDPGNLNNLTETKRGCYWEEWLIPGGLYDISIVRCQDQGVSLLAITPFIIVSPVFIVAMKIQETFFSDFFGLLLGIGLASFFGLLAAANILRRGFIVFCWICFSTLLCSLVIRTDLYPELFIGKSNRGWCSWETPYRRDMIMILHGPSRMVCPSEPMENILNIPNYVTGIRISERIHEANGSSRLHVSWFHKSISNTIFIAAFIFFIHAPLLALRYSLTTPKRIGRTPFFFAYLIVCFIVGRMILSKDIYDIASVVTLLSLSALLAIGSATLQEKWHARKLATTPAADTPGTPPAALPPPAL